MPDKILKWNNDLLTWSGNYIRTYIAPPVIPWPTDGLIARWPLQSDLKNTVTGEPDLHLYAGDESYTSGGLSGNAFTFNGTRCCSTYREDGWPTSALSISYWIHQDTAFERNPWQIDNAINPVNPPKRLIGVMAPGAQYWGTTAGNVWSGDIDKTGLNNLQDAWWHMVLTFNGTGAKIYRNNVVDTSLARTLTDATSLQYLFIGRGWGVPIEAGWMQFVYYYNRELIASEVNTLYNGGYGL